MKKQEHSRWISILVIVTFSMTMALASGGTWAAESKYPNRLIQIVVPFVPGATDVLLRPFIEKLPGYLKQPVSYVYKPGAGGATGTSFVAKANPDGYTLCGTTTNQVVTIPLTMDVDYTLDDFVPICGLVRSPVLIAVKADSRWKTLKDMVADAKKSPGKFTYASSGVFTGTHVPMEILSKLAGIKLTHVPCKGGGDSVTALLGGHVDMVCAVMPPLIPHIKSQTLQPIATLERKRLKELPNVPTLTELGYSHVSAGVYGIFAPKGTPPEVVNTLYSAFKKVTEDHKDFVEARLANVSANLDFQNPEEFTKFVKEEKETLTPMLKELKDSIK